MNQLTIALPSFHAAQPRPVDFNSLEINGSHDKQIAPETYAR